MKIFLVDMCRGCLKTDCELTVHSNLKKKNSKHINNINYCFPDLTLIKKHSGYKLCRSCTIFLEGTVLFRRKLVKSEQFYKTYVSDLEYRNAVNNAVFSKLEVSLGNEEEFNYILPFNIKSELENQFDLDDFNEDTSLFRSPSYNHHVSNDNSVTDSINILVPKHEIECIDVSTNINSENNVCTVETHNQSDKEADVVSLNMNECALKEEEEPPPPPSLATTLPKNEAEEVAVTNGDVGQREEDADALAAAPPAQKAAALRFPCNICEQAFQWRSSLHKHKRKHLKERRFACDRCNKAYRQKYNLDKHKVIHTGVKAFACEYCSKTFFYENNLRDHERVHTGEKPFECNMCGKRFARSGNLATHENTHKKYRAFKCEHCAKAFKQNSHLRKHLKTHLEKEKTERKAKEKSKKAENRFVCKYCNKAFSQMSRVVVHERVHTNEKPFACGYCGKSFARNCHLQIHERLHTGERPYACKFCDACFASGSTLLVHERIHTGVKPYKCDHCERAFPVNNQLKEHVRRHHTGEKPYVCGLCQKAFAARSNFVAHQKVHLKNFQGTSITTA